jgi:hypothetical protein
LERCDVKKQEFDTRVSEWRRRYNEEFSKENPDIPEDWELHWDVLATCRTEGCPWQSKTHRLTISEQLDGVYKVLCASCNRPVEDLDPMLEDHPDFRLNTRLSDGSSWMIVE